MLAATERYVAGSAMPDTGTTMGGTTTGGTITTGGLTTGGTTTGSVGSTGGAGVAITGVATDSVGLVGVEEVFGVFGLGCIHGSGLAGGMGVDGVLGVGTSSEPPPPHAVSAPIRITPVRILVYAIRFYVLVDRFRRVAYSFVNQQLCEVAHASSGSIWLLVNM